MRKISELYEKVDSLRNSNRRLQALLKNREKDTYFLLKVYLETTYGIDFDNPKNDWGIYIVDNINEDYNDEVDKAENFGVTRITSTLEEFTEKGKKIAKIVKESSSWYGRTKYLLIFQKENEDEVYDLLLKKNKEIIEKRIERNEKKIKEIKREIERLKKEEKREVREMIEYIKKITDSEKIIKTEYDQDIVGGCQEYTSKKVTKNFEIVLEETVCTQFGYSYEIHLNVYRKGDATPIAGWWHEYNRTGQWRQLGYAGPSYLDETETEDGNSDPDIIQEVFRRI